MTKIISINPNSGINVIIAETIENNAVITVITIYQIIYLPQPIDPIKWKISPNLNAAPNSSLCAIFAIAMLRIKNVTRNSNNPTKNNPDPNIRLVYDVQLLIISLDGIEVIANVIPIIIIIKGIREYTIDTTIYFKPSMNIAPKLSNAGGSVPSSVDSFIVLNVYPSTKNKGIIRIESNNNTPSTRTLPMFRVG